MRCSAHWPPGWGTFSNLSPFPHLDLTPFAFTITGLAVVWGFFRYCLLDVVPLAHDLGTMRADSTKLRQVLLNLLGNAAKFTRQGRATLAVDRIVGPGGAAGEERE